MPEWKEYIRPLVGTYAYAADLAPMDITIIRDGDGDWRIELSVPKLRHYFQGSDDEAKRLALDRAEDYLNHLLAQVRAMKEGTDEAR